MNFEMLVLGDSVTWGQGLRTSDKFWSLCCDLLRARHSDWSFSAEVRAHSGAVIKTKSVEPAGVAGEVPVSYPSIRSQIEKPSPARDEVNLVLINGGINDIDIRFILNPFSSSFDLLDVIRQHCFDDMTDLLYEAGTAYSNATVVLLGYYPILSRKSSLQPIPQFMDCLGAPISHAFSESLLLDQVVKHALLFWTESDERFSEAAEYANRRLGSARVHFVEPPFTESNSVFADDPWLFGLARDFGAVDPIAAERRLECNACIPAEDVLAREQCYRASAGHPNQVGSLKYAQAIDQFLITKGI